MLNFVTPVLDADEARRSTADLQHFIEEKNGIFVASTQASFFSYFQKFIVPMAVVCRDHCFLSTFIYCMLVKPVGAPLSVYSRLIPRSAFTTHDDQNQLLNATMDVVSNSHL